MSTNHRQNVNNISYHSISQLAQNNTRIFIGQHAYSYERNITWHSALDKLRHVMNYLSKADVRLLSFLFFFSFYVNE